MANRAVIRPGETTVTLSAGRSSRKTAAPVAKFAPVIVNRTVSAEATSAGFTDAIEGAGPVTYTVSVSGLQESRRRGTRDTVSREASLDIGFFLIGVTDLNPGRRCKPGFLARDHGSI